MSLVSSNKTDIVLELYNTCNHYNFQMAVLNQQIGLELIILLPLSPYRYHHIELTMLTVDMDMCYLFTKWLC